MILKYYNQSADVGVLDITEADVQKFFDDYFDSAQRLNKHKDRRIKGAEYPKPVDVALYNTLTEGFWKFNGPLQSIASIHLKGAEQEQAKNNQVDEVIQDVK